jgi:hypothetical protein
MGQSKTRRSGKRVIGWAELRDFSLTLPGVVEGVCFGTPALYVRKRFLARLREDGETVAVKCDLLERDALLEAAPGAFFLTDHYRPYPMILMRLGRVRGALARELVEQAWRREAPKRLTAQRLSNLSSEAGRDATGTKARRAKPKR